MGSDDDANKLSVDLGNLFGRKRTPPAEPAETAPATPEPAEAPAPVEAAKPAPAKPAAPAAPEPTVVIETAPVAAEPTPAPVAKPAPVVAKPVEVVTPVPAVVAPEPVEAVTPVPAVLTPAAKPVAPVATKTIEREPAAEVEEDDAQPATKTRRIPRLPTVNLQGGLRGTLPTSLPRIGGLTGYQAAAATGLLCGALMVASTVLLLKMCTLVNGAETCGGPGALLLILMMALTVWAGKALLTVFGVVEPGTTSFLAVSLVAVFCLIFLVSVLMNWPMIIVIPALSIGAFCFSHWIATAFIDPADG